MLRARIEELEKQIEYLQARLWQAEYRECAHPVCLESTKHRRFILGRLHPDVNGGTREANIATRLFLDLNERARELTGNAGEGW